MNHSFDIDDAVRYGFKEAVLLANLKFWIAKNKANGKHFYDGTYWTYNSVKAWAELFPYFSEKQIRTALVSLVEKGVIVTGEYNKSQYDHTKWYSINVSIDLPNRANGDAQEGSSTTYINTDSKHSLSKGTNVPLCPQQKIKDLYVEKLSEWLPSIKIWSDARAKALQARWKFMLTASRSDGTRFATNEGEGMAMFAKFFDFVAASDFLCGRKDGSGFVADIDFLLTQSKFIRVIEGFYSNKNNEVKS